ncbi:c-type cytochrome [Flavobacterium hydatis]|jgi:cytochrome c|uniref:Cytochrome C552 n=1 Tax=Flavobacterium hydatis TaxID=991 RepID=A0A086AS09_FLAHY|nr:c-type cytochrome [Flavobacterium hydatis]KFF19473.1 cytochrome C552 [Flavobacterium hydatis]OXA96395.1 cytochrome C552 [Flavobacterium hydatis]
MKKIILAFAILAFVSCKKEEKVTIDNSGMPSEESATLTAKTPEELGKAIFEGQGNCFACHQVDQKVIGPSIKEIAKIYKEKNGDMVTFLKGKADPIVDPSQFDVMKTNFPVTQAMSDEELKALETYFYSFLK